MIDNTVMDQDFEHGFTKNLPVSLTVSINNLFSCQF